ncbi:MAG: 50S ribosomal protein L21 [Candidatus Vogelbacteria bacterium]|nr:50S ribosomal protein L21 [Candidatus Vogelbacteria bacterium]
MKFAVIKTGGKQYRVAEGQTLRVEKLDVETGKPVIFNEVLLTRDGEEIKIGTPIVAGATVTGEIIDQNRAKKVVVLKYKAKTRYRVKRGHRQPYTQVKITRIDF